LDSPVRSSPGLATREYISCDSPKSVQQTVTCWIKHDFRFGLTEINHLKPPSHNLRFRFDFISQFGPVAIFAKENLQQVLS
jgi:hypothetical protein